MIISGFNTLNNQFNTLCSERHQDDINERRDINNFLVSFSSLLVKKENLFLDDNTKTTFTQNKIIFGSQPN